MGVGGGKGLLICGTVLGESKPRGFCKRNSICATFVTEANTFSTVAST